MTRTCDHESRRVGTQVDIARVDSIAKNLRTVKMPTMSAKTLRSGEGASGFLGSMGVRCPLSD
jgi:hypothetical protein